MKSRKRQGRSIEDIVEQLRDGARREESFRLVFDRFYGPLFRFFERRGFSTQECQDLIQETFLRVYLGIEDFRGDARWEHWLFRIAANTAVKARRHGAAAKRAGRTVPWEEKEAMDSPRADAGPPGMADPSPLRQLLDKEKKELVSQAIAGLPAQMRRCMRMRVFQGLAYEEIAEALKIAPATVKVQLLKARKRLQIELGDTFTDLDP